jgi:hypothetical protein
MEGSGSSVLVSYYPIIFLKVLRKNSKIISMDGQYPLRDLNSL